MVCLGKGKTSNGVDNVVYDYHHDDDDIDDYDNLTIKRKPKPHGVRVIPAEKYGDVTTRRYGGIHFIDVTQRVRRKRFARARRFRHKDNAVTVGVRPVLPGR